MNVKTTLEPYEEALIQSIEKDPLEAARILRQYARGIQIEKNIPFTTLDVKAYCLIKGAKAIEKLDKQGNIIESIFKEIDDIILLSAPKDLIKVDVI